MKSKRYSILRSAAFGHDYIGSADSLDSARRKIKAHAKTPRGARKYRIKDLVSGETIDIDLEGST